MKRLQLPRNKVARLGIYIFFIVFWTLLKMIILGTFGLVIVEEVISNAINQTNIMFINPLLLGYFLACILVFTYIIGLIVFTKKIWFPIQLPKNKFARLGIYIFIVVFWTFLLTYQFYYVLHFPLEALVSGDLQNTAAYFSLGYVVLFSYIVGLIVFTKKIWFPKRARIKRLKD